jgi:hypothetical protein
MTNRLLLVPVMTLTLALSMSVRAFGQDSVRDCSAVLAKDYYAYAQKHDLDEDFLRTVDAESWEQFQKSGSTGANLFDIFSFSDDYKTFNEKRNKYLESVHYARTEQQAENILQIVTAARAYPAYETCLRTVANGPALRVWASSEDMEQIQLRVRYVNPPNVKSMTMQGFVGGGKVTGAPKGRLWAGSKTWGVSQEFLFEINRIPGTSSTNVVVVPADGSAPVSLTFRRADAVLTARYDGTVEVFRQDRHTAAVTPNHDHNRNGCPNMVGRADGKWCISRTTATLTTSAPRFFRDPQRGCAGGACPWSSFPTAAQVENNGLTAVAQIDNWGSPVTLTLSVREFERLDAAQCGHSSSVPVIRDEPVVLAVRKECAPMATLQWRTFPAGQGALRFGDEGTAQHPVARVGPQIDNGTVILATYKLK